MKQTTENTFPGFTAKDFDVFAIDGLEPRMEALIERIRPKLTTLGEQLQPHLSTLCGEEMFVHVAKHARRTVNPPKDTWVAWAANKRGYKALPHFEVGMFGSHVFVVFAIIYESPRKKDFGRAMTEHLKKVKHAVPDHFYWSPDHMSPHGTPQSELSDQELLDMADRLQQVKKSEIICGLRLDKNDPLLQDGEKFAQTVEDTFEQLLPLYKMAFA
ncbi:YktB family protein [Paenibacillus sp. WLX1005]|uniref:YktB family protein n=1 Tax=Paenibacillus sp. WLX1005 TaxID=3243766 RepID=UPI00398402DE